MNTVDTPTPGSEAATPRGNVHINRSSVTTPPASRGWPLRYGLQALRGLGLRLTELAHMSPLSVATLKRYTGTEDPAFVETRASLERLTLQTKEALTRIWIRHIAGDRLVAPPVPQRAFLDFFCPRCLHRPPPRSGTATNEAGHRDVTPFVLDRLLPAELLEALTSGVRTCDTGPRVCASSPARFAAVLLALRLHPWEAYGFVTSEIAPARWWLRPCLGCGRDVITGSPAMRLCPPCRARAR
jgi:hypothetical protein